MNLYTKYLALYDQLVNRNLVTLDVPVLGNFYLYITEMVSCYFYSISQEPSILLAIVPIVLYSNAGLQKKLIKQENKAKAGIYRWVNLINGKTYIGSGLNVSNRLSHYFSAKFMETYLKTGKSAIYSALIKHGCYNFSLEILEFCSVENLIQREQYFIDTLKPEYNICKTAGSTLGKTHSEETRANISASLIGNSNGKNQPNSIKIEVTDLQTGISTSYISMREAARALNILQSSIIRYFKNNQKKPVKGRYIFVKR
jgi:hypothetical protein